MTDDLAELEKLAGAMLRQAGPTERRRLLRSMARDLRGSQAARILRQREPDGAPYAPRKARREEQRGTYAIKFLYPKGDPHPRLVFMSSWVRQGPLITGYDTEAGGIRSFFWDRIDKFLGVAPEEQNKGAGKYRRRGGIRRKLMFRKLASGRNLKAGATDMEAWVGFAGRVADIARVHQDGLLDKPAAKGKAVRYARRTLLGVTEAERGHLLDLLLKHVTGGIDRA